MNSPAADRHPSERSGPCTALLSLHQESKKSGVFGNVRYEAFG
jgi:hypothetical protein